MSKTNLLITTEIIIGFPGETKEDIAGLIRFLRRFKNWHEIVLFNYSPRKGTLSFFYKPEVSERIKIERCSEIVKRITGRDIFFKHFVKKRIIFSDSSRIED